MRAAESATPAFFLDPNILVYAFSAQDPAKRETARTLAEAEGAHVSTQVLSELANVLTRRFGMSARETRQRILNIANACEVVQITPAIVLDALRIMERFRFGFFDSQIIASALSASTPVLYTEDLHHDQVIDGSLTIRSPFAMRAEQVRRRYKSGARAAGARA